MNKPTTSTDQAVAALRQLYHSFTGRHLPEKEALRLLQEAKPK